MKRILVMLPVILAALTFNNHDVSALEWPVTELAPSRFFGQRAAGVIERGITFEKTDTVHASGNGILLYTMTQNRNMNGFPGTLGNAAIIKHDDGLLTIYGNLEDVERINERIHIDLLSTLSRTGQSGWGNPLTLLFQVVDGDKKNILNPLLLLPPLKDSIGPSIKNVVALSQQNQQFTLGSVKSVRQGKYRIFAEVTDTLDKSSIELSPFRISVLINGSEYLTIPFEVLKNNQGRLFLSTPDYVWETLYAESERMYLGEITLTRGRSDISIIARDIAGNERSVVFGLQIE